MIIDFPLCFLINKKIYGKLKSWNDQKNSGEDKSFETFCYTGTQSGVSDTKKVYPIYILLSSLTKSLHLSRYVKISSINDA